MDRIKKKEVVKMNWVNFNPLESKLIEELSTAEEEMLKKVYFVNEPFFINKNLEKKLDGREGMYVVNVDLKEGKSGGIFTDLPTIDISPFIQPITTISSTEPEEIYNLYFTFLFQPINVLWQFKRVVDKEFLDSSLEKLKNFKYKSFKLE